MFIKIQNSTFNINDISYVAPHPVSSHLLIVQMISDPDHPHRFNYSSKAEAAEAANKATEQILKMVALYGKR